VKSVLPGELALLTELAEDDVKVAVQWLVDRAYASYATLAGDVHITAIGVDRAEEIADRQADLPPLVLTVDETRMLEAFVRDAHLAIEASGLAGEDLADAEAQLATIEAQARSPRPRRDVIGAALRALKWTAGTLLAGVLGNAAYEGLLALAT